MKKRYLLGGMIFISLVIMTGCGEKTKTLNCIKAEKQTGINSVSEMKLTFKNDSIKLVESKSEVSVTLDTYQKNIDLMYNALQEQFAEAKEDKGVIVKTSKTSDSVTVKITVDAKKSPEQVQIVGSSLNHEMNYEEAKKNLEDLDYSCK